MYFGFGNHSYFDLSGQEPVYTAKKVYSRGVLSTDYQFQLTFLDYGNNGSETVLKQYTGKIGIHWNEIRYFYDVGADSADLLKMTYLFRDHRLTGKINNKSGEKLFFFQLLVHPRKSKLEKMEQSYFATKTPESAMFEDNSSSSSENKSIDLTNHETGSLISSKSDTYY